MGHLYHGYVSHNQRVSASEKLFVRPFKKKATNREPSPGAWKCKKSPLRSLRILWIAQPPWSRSQTKGFLCQLSYHQSAPAENNPLSLMEFAYFVVDIMIFPFPMDFPMDFYVFDGHHDVPMGISMLSAKLRGLEKGRWCWLSNAWDALHGDHKETR